MDYVVGGVAALISGNVTPNRPKIIRKALTPTKHQPSPNVTPKSQVVDDRSVFLSPSVQKKKAIIKKSPKRIFQAPSLDETDDAEGVNLTSPKADKAKKHLQNELESSGIGSVTATEPTPSKSAKKKSKQKRENENVGLDEPEPAQKKRKSSDSEETIPAETPLSAKSKKKNKKNKKKQPISQDNAENESNEVNSTLETENKIPKKLKKKSELATKENNQENEEETEAPITKKSKKKSKNNEAEILVNPNAITDKDSDSEHESDNEINSDQSDDVEIEQPNDLAGDAAAESSEEEEEKESPKKEKKEYVVDETEVKRTIFVGNVPFSSKCKKQIKKIFSKHGEIQTVRIRTIPVKDARLTPKLALIKNELHPERNTVNVYVKFKDISSAEQALAENNSVLESHHLRVSPAASSGAEHDPRRALYVGNVPFACEDDTLRERFEKCGAIVSVRIVRDRKTNAGKGFAYVNFESKDAVELALGLSDEDLTIKNRILRVQRCNAGQGRAQQNATPLKQGQNRQGPPQNRQGQSQNRQGQSQNRQGQSQNRQGPPQNRQGPPQNRQGWLQNGKGPPQNRQGPPQKRQGPAQNGRGQGHRQRTDLSQRQPVDGTQGAYRRIKKRKSEEAGEAAPTKEKKQKKEFVGVTAEKKKKQKFQKGQKKKKALSEILTK